MNALSPEAKKLITDAVTILKEEGWTRHTYERNGRYCMYGALRKAACGNALSVPAEEFPYRVYYEADNALSLAAWERFDVSSVDFNDSQVNKDCVIKFMEEVAAS
jgi:hypothetical protein